MGTLLFMRDALLTLKLGAGTAVEYQGQVSTAAVEVEAGDTVTYPVLDGTIPTQIGPSTYALHLVAAQDWDSAGGLARFLWTNEGADAAFVLQAHGQDAITSDAMPAATGTVRLVAGSYGGEVGTYAELDVTLPCAVKPTLATAPVALADQALDAWPGERAPADVEATLAQETPRGKGRA